MIDLVLKILIVAFKGFAFLSLLIVGHELGHFLVAKFFGVWVEEFGLGLPPRALKKKFGETIFSLNFLPVGGFVKLHGETNGEEVSYPDRAFVNKGKIARILISLAGVVANFIMAFLAFAIVYSFVGVPRETGTVRIVDVSEGTPAQIVGFVVGDVVKKVDNKEVHSTKSFIAEVESKKGKRTVIEIERSTESLTEARKITVTPRSDPPQGEGPLGVAISSTETYFAPIWQRPFIGAWYGAREAVSTSKAVVLGLFGIATDVSKGQVPKGTVGPFGIFALIEYVWRLGPIPLINFLGIISINLAIINLVPFPPLDGSRVLFIGIEAFFGKKILPKAESIIYTTGMILLLLLMFAITAREIPNAFKAGSINSFVETIVK
ncbi:MAG: M50 family metallopeptidase [Patescibacteria group bacterium]